MKRLVVVGDSDIAFWPKELLPSSTGDDENENGVEWERPIVSGHSGATLAEVLPHLRTILARINDDDDDDGRTPTTAAASTPDTLVVLVCAGENDIGEGLSLERSVESLREFLDVVFLDDSYAGKGGDDHRYLLFLGPKFEPWLEHDPTYKKKYNAMTRAFQRCLQEYSYKAEKRDTIINIKDTKNTYNNTALSNYSTINDHRIHFIDCLTMFCGETANLPGARLGGRAQADPRFFASDQLHLNKEGYEVWKDVVETKIRQCVSSSK